MHRSLASGTTEPPPTQENSDIALTSHRSSPFLAVGLYVPTRV